MPPGAAGALGSEGFRQELPERMEGQLGGHHAGDLKRETAEVRAERIIPEELEREGWTEAQLAPQRKGDAVKLALAARLRRAFAAPTLAAPEATPRRERLRPRRRKTTLTMGWIAQRLQMGTGKSLVARLQEVTHRSRLTPAG